MWRTHARPQVCIAVAKSFAARNAVEMEASYRRDSNWIFSRRSPYRNQVQFIIRGIKVGSH